MELLENVEMELKNGYLIQMLLDMNLLLEMAHASQTLDHAMLYVIDRVRVPLG